MTFMELTNSRVLGDQYRLHEKSEGQFGEHPKGGRDTLCHTDGTAQWDPVAPGVRADPDLGRGVALGPGVEALLNIKVKLEAEIATYYYLLKEEGDFDLKDTKSMQST